MVAAGGGGGTNGDIDGWKSTGYGAAGGGLIGYNGFGTYYGDSSSRPTSARTSTIIATSASTPWGPSLSTTITKSSIYICNIAGTGGGATDVRIAKSTTKYDNVHKTYISNNTDLFSRIMVAAGGGGGTNGDIDGWKSTGYKEKSVDNYTFLFA